MLEFLRKSLPILVVAALVLSGTTAVADIISDLEVHYTFADAGNLAANAGTGADGTIVADGAGTLTQVAGPGGSISLAITGRFGLVKSVALPNTVAQGKKNATSTSKMMNNNATT